MCVCGNVVHMRQLLNIPVSLLDLGVFRERFPVSPRLPDAVVARVLILFVERNTSLTTSHKSRAGNPSIRSPASNEMISDS